MTTKYFQSMNFGTFNKQSQFAAMHLVGESPYKGKIKQFDGPLLSLLHKHEFKDLIHPIFITKGYIHTYCALDYNIDFQNN